MLPTLSADLLFTRAPTLLPQAVLLKVRELVSDVTWQPPTAQTPAAFFGHPGGLRTMFLTSDQAPPAATWAEALLHETAWVEAQSIVTKVRSVITLAELAEAGIDEQLRLDRFSKVVVGCVRALGADAVHWKSTNRLFAPHVAETWLVEGRSRRALVG